MFRGHSLEEISKNYSNVKIMTQTEFQALVYRNAVCAAAYEMEQPGAK